MVTYGYTIDNINIAIQKAKTKNDGIYTFRGFKYRVVKNKIVAVAWNGKILQSFGHFDVELGTYNDSYKSKDDITMLKKVDVGGF